MKTHRPLYIIAADIRANWKKPVLPAFPYIFALRHLDRATDYFGADSAENIIAYFLANARTWQGPEACRIKTELKTILEGNEDEMQRLD